MADTLNFAVGNRITPLPKSKSVNIARNESKQGSSWPLLSWRLDFGFSEYPYVLHLLIGIVLVLVLLWLNALHFENYSANIIGLQKFSCLLFYADSLPLNMSNR